MWNLLPTEGALKVLTGYPNEGPSMSWVESHRTARALWVEAIGPPTPIGCKFGGAVEETLFEDCAPSATGDPPLVLRAAVGTVMLHENCCYLGNQKPQFNTTYLEKTPQKRTFWTWSNKNYVNWGAHLNLAPQISTELKFSSKRSKLEVVGKALMFVLTDRQTHTNADKDCLLFKTYKGSVHSSSLFHFIITQIKQAIHINTQRFKVKSFINTGTDIPLVLQLTETWVAVGADRAAAMFC